MGTWTRRQWGDTSWHFIVLLSMWSCTLKICWAACSWPVKGWLSEDGTRMGQHPCSTQGKKWEASGIQVVWCRQCNGWTATGKPWSSMLGGTIVTMISCSWQQTWKCMQQRSDKTGNILKSKPVSLSEPVNPQKMYDMHIQGYAFTLL